MSIAMLKGQADNKNVVSYTLRAEKASLHEPVIIDITINNILKEPLRIDLGPDKRGAFRLTVVSPSGQRTQIPSLARKGEGIVFSGLISLNPGQSHTQSLVLDEWCDFSEIGRYLIEMQLNSGPETGKGATANLLSKQYRATMEITAKNTERLNRVYTNLLQLVLESKTHGQAVASASALSYAKDPIAVTYLENLLRSNKMVEEYAISGLRRIGDNGAVEVLISVLKIQKGDVADLARSALADIESGSADPILKERIKRALR
jgi:hypothetical protein